MAHKITEDCVACGTCLTECPLSAIKEGEELYTIDAAKCDDCAKCVEVCPTEAIVKA